MNKYALLKTLCEIKAPSGDEIGLRDFLIKFIDLDSENWKNKPILLFGEGYQESLVVIVGKPTTAIYAHMDNIGFMVSYNNKVTPVGSPLISNGLLLCGTTKEGYIETSLIESEEKLSISSEQVLERGTYLCFKPNWREDENNIQCCYLDNRAGIFSALMAARELENIALVFGQWEEHGGGSVGYLSKHLFQTYNIRQALIADITWVTEGVHAGKGVVISLRDKAIPSRRYVNRIRELLDKHAFTYQLEVEQSGGSDGHELQRIPYPIDWCFIGAPQLFSHSPDEKINKHDLDSMIEAYTILGKEL